MGAFLDEPWGFLPIVVPVTEPAVGYGAAGGLAFIGKPSDTAGAGLGRPNISFVGGLGTENGTWGAFAGDLRQWKNDRVQTLVGFFDASLNLDFNGIGEGALPDGQPLAYNLKPIGGLAQAKLRLGGTRAWLGLNYMLAVTDVTFEAPEGTPGLPDTERESRVGGLTPSFTYDSRDTIFTPGRGTYVDASFGFFGSALGGDDAFERGALVAMQFLGLQPKLTLGLRGDLGLTFGDAPFYLRPYVSMRGAPVLRYQGEQAASLETELRWQFWKRLSLVGFAGYGAAWNDFERFENTQSLVTGGGGVRYELARATSCTRESTSPSGRTGRRSTFSSAAPGRGREPIRRRLDVRLASLSV